MKKWTEEELAILIDNYATVSKEFLCDNLLSRTWDTIRKKAQQLELYRDYQRGSPEERFWKYVDKKSDNECWNWLGVCNNKGYGKIKINQKDISAHRFSWELHFGKIPKDLYICHHCDNPPCVNPNHLFLGTSKDNIDDMKNKNRQAKGENNGNSKLTSKQVEEIKRLYYEGKITQIEIAKIFNVAHTTILNINRNKTWKHI